MEQFVFLIVSPLAQESPFSSLKPIRKRLEMNLSSADLSKVPSDCYTIAVITGIELLLPVLFHAHSSVWHFRICDYCIPVACDIMASKSASISS